jgi:hypothetical protein
LRAQHRERQADQYEGQHQQAEADFQQCAHDVLSFP